ncbi:MAG TPA: NAD-dependent epimerase/dehydratase family protein [Aggregatilineales bacterium]|nr:NAD-dependent epimerase/dehydratase family protein [Anaerolineales bacterium]HRE48972.1 NAD-dependent epimerase/dehydratase family protein [Aggregatilineales bacterium]
MTDTVFVTGGTGHLGRSLLPLLAQSGFRVRTLTRRPQDHAWLQALPNVEIISGAVEDAALMNKAVVGCRYVIHAAGLFSFWGLAGDFNQTNLKGTQNVLNAAVAAGVEKFIHISTVVVIGTPQRGRVIDESYPPAPVDPYQVSKYEGECAVLAAHRDHGLAAVVLRPGAFYGPHSRYAFNRLFIEDPLKGIRLQVNGGRNLTFPIYVGDVARAAILALTQGIPGERYNLSNPPITHKAVNRIVSEEAGIPRWRINVPNGALVILARAWEAISRLTRIEPYYPINLRTYVFYDWNVSSEKARVGLGFQPISFAEGVRHTLAWYHQIGLWKGKHTPAPR